MSQDQEKNTNEELPPTNLPNLQMQALLGEMRRMMRVELEHIHERLDRVEEGTQRGQPPFTPNAPRRNRLHQREIDEVGEFEGDDLEEFDRIVGIYMCHKDRKSILGIFCKYDILILIRGGYSCLISCVLFTFICDCMVILSKHKILFGY